MFCILERWPLKKKTCTRATLEFDSREVPGYPKFTLCSLKWGHDVPSEFQGGYLWYIYIIYIYYIVLLFVKFQNICVSWRSWSSLRPASCYGGKADEAAEASRSLEASLVARRVVLMDLGKQTSKESTGLISSCHNYTHLSWPQNVIWDKMNLQ